MVRIARSAAELRDFLDETVINSNLVLKRITFSELTHWSLAGGSLSHSSNGFFHVAGVRHRITQEEHLVLYQPQTALTGLALFRDGRDIYLLLQARIEPGLPNAAQYGPTVQSSPTNYLQMHGGRRTSYTELFRGYSPISNPLANNIQSDLGKRYFQKNKVHSYVELANQIETQENMIWVPLGLVAETLGSDNFLNQDLRSLLSCFDWDLFCGSAEVQSGGIKRETGDSFILPNNLLGTSDWQLIGVDQLKGWEVRQDGIANLSGEGVWVDLFHISCFTREVRAWSQPLMCCANRGLVILLMRVIDGHSEFLLNIETEFGISGQRTFLPSIVIYPGDNGQNISDMIESESVLAEIEQAEEGNRFFDNESIYRVMHVARDIEIKPQQQWVTAETLKAILKSSAIASLQLRAIASLVLDLLNPIAFAR